jgi:hypothetical protein
MMMMNFLNVLYENVSPLLVNDRFISIVNYMDSLLTTIANYYYPENLLHFLDDQLNKYISLIYRISTCIKDMDIYINICDINFYYIDIDLNFDILLKALIYLGLIFLIIELLLLIFSYLNILLKSDDESAIIPTNQVAVSSRRNRNDTFVAPPSNPAGSTPTPPDSDNSFVEAATGFLTLLWYSIKRNDIRNHGYSDEYTRSMTDESVKNMGVVNSPAYLPDSFTNSNELNILNCNFLYHVDNKHYNVLDYDRYNLENVLRNQDVRQVYGSCSESVENTLRDFLKCNNRITPGIFGEEPRPYTRDVWGAYITMDPPIIPGIGNPNPVLPSQGANLNDITDPYMHSAVKIITTEVYPPGENNLNTNRNDYDVIDEKKLTDLKYIFLFYKASGNADLNWEKAVQSYALQFHKNPWILQGQGEEFKAYMKMLDWVEMMHHTRNRSTQL